MLVAFAQRVQAVALARMHLTRERQGVDDLADVARLSRRPRQTLQLGIEEGQVERRVVDDQLGAADELEQLLDHVGEARLLRQELVGEAVHLDGAAVHFSIRPQIAMEGATGLAPVHHLDAADFDDAVALLEAPRPVVSVSRMI